MAFSSNLREDSWELPNSESRSEGSLEVMEDDQEYAEETDEEQPDQDSEGHDDATMSSPDPFTGGDIEKAFHPLRAVADRVGQQVEEFAEILDRFNAKKQRNKRVNYQHALDLVGEYKRIALETVKRLEKFHALELRERLNRSWNLRLQRSRRQADTRLDQTRGSKHLGLKTTVEDLQRWQLEAQTWELLEQLLKARYRASGFAMGNSEVKSPEPTSNVHRYSPESKVWARFLAEDDLAWERHTVVAWLMRSADTSSQNVDTIIEHLETGAERGTGLWAHGWLYTKEAIKAQKRLRSWPQALDPTSPGIESTHLSSDQTETLVTQLDPDATTRQDRALERQDQYFENATWLACWEMIRRGKDWDTIREWCQDRVEGWRAISLQGHLPNSSAPPMGKTTQFTRSAVTNNQSGSLWRRMCYAAATHTDNSDYERALYGVLSGDIDTVEQVCRSWDDLLFAYYNALLLHQFDAYLQSNYPGRLPAVLSNRFDSPSCAVFHDEPGLVGRNLVEKLKTNKATKSEAKDPMKTLQGCLIANTFDEFVYKQGLALSGMAEAKGKSKIIPAVKQLALDDTTTTYIAIEDYDSLRVITHMILIFQDLGMDFRHSTHCTAVENIVVAYIDFLRLAGKTGTLPLYASRLSAQRSVLCLGREFNDIVTPQERKMLVELMKQLGIDVVSVLTTQLELILGDMESAKATNQQACKLSILEDSATAQQMLRPIRKQFIDLDLKDDEEALLRCFEWYVLLEGEWYLTLSTGAALYKFFLRSNRLAAARALSISVPFSQLSMEKTGPILGKKVDVSRSIETSEDENHEDLGTSGVTRMHKQQMERRRRRSSSAARAGARRDNLKSVGRIYRELQELVVALDALETWANIAHQLKGNAHPHDAKTWKTELRSAVGKVTAAVEPLLNGWLLHPMADKDAPELAEIRIAYLPEIVLAYNSVLHFAGHAISREMLLQSMELAATVAAKGSDVAACFVSAGRMFELVDAFAITSKAILKANEQGSKANKGRKKTAHGETLDLWTVKGS
ncbi:MAG: Nucleoporin nup84 [Pleopsidium flavum]|nr:MAG: Nucleoporin nup84 [Pleopsidium flavum]